MPKRGKNMGIDIMRVWMATKDDRTRNSHKEIDGEKRPVGKAFSNGCMFPGDPSARPAEVYNCRCTFVASVDGIDYNASDEENIARINGTYDEWLKQSKRKGAKEKTGDGLLKPVEAKNEDFDYSLTTKDGNAVVIESYEKHSSVSEKIYKDSEAEKIYEKYAFENA